MRLWGPETCKLEGNKNIENTTLVEVWIVVGNGSKTSILFFNRISRKGRLHLYRHTQTTHYIIYRVDQEPRNTEVSKFLRNYFSQKIFSHQTRK